MSILCSRACTIVILYCAVLIIQPSGTASVRDLKSSSKKPSDSRFERTVNLFQAIQRSTHSSDVNMINSVKTLPVNLDRKKRISHHGRQNRMWKPTHVTMAKYNSIIPKISSRQRTPVICFKDIENDKKNKRFLSSKYAGDKLDASDPIRNRVVLKSKKRRRSMQRRSNNQTQNQISDVNKNEKVSLVDGQLNNTIGMLLPMVHNKLVPTLSREKEMYHVAPHLDVSSLDDTDDFTSASASTTRINKDVKTEDVVPITPRPAYNNINRLETITNTKLPLNVNIDPIFGINQKSNESENDDAQFINKREAPSIALQTVQITIPSNSDSLNIRQPLTIAHQDVTVSLSKGYSHVIKNDQFTCGYSEANGDFFPNSMNAQIDTPSAECIERTTTCDIGVTEKCPTGECDSTAEKSKTINFCDIDEQLNKFAKQLNDSEIQNNLTDYTYPTNEPNITENNVAFTSDSSTEISQKRDKHSTRSSTETFTSSTVKFKPDISNIEQSPKIYKFSKPDLVGHNNIPEHELEREHPLPNPVYLTTVIRLRQSTSETTFRPPISSPPPPMLTQQPVVPTAPAVAPIAPVVAPIAPAVAPNAPQSSENVTVQLPSTPPLVSNPPPSGNPPSAQAAQAVISHSHNPNPPPLSSVSAFSPNMDHLPQYPQSINTPPATVPSLNQFSAKSPQGIQQSGKSPPQNVTPQTISTQPAQVNSTAPAVTQSVIINLNGVPGQLINQSKLVETVWPPNSIQVTTQKDSEDNYVTEWFEVPSKTAQTDRLIVNGKFRRDNVSSFLKLSRADDIETAFVPTRETITPLNMTLSDISMIESLPYIYEDESSNFLFPNTASSLVPEYGATYYESINPVEECSTVKEDPWEELNLKRRNVDDAEILPFLISSPVLPSGSTDNLHEIMKLTKRDTSTTTLAQNNLSTSTAFPATTPLTASTTPSTTISTTGRYYETSNVDSLIVPSTVSYYKVNDNISTSPTGVIPAYSYPDLSVDENAVNLVRRDVETTTCGSTCDPSSPECENSTCPPSDGTSGTTDAANTSAPASANGTTASNGAASNGAASNGAASNGAATNGAATNGAASNGTTSNGAASNGNATNGAASNGAASNGAATNGAATNGSNGAATSNGVSASNGITPAAGVPPVLGAAPSDLSSLASLAGSGNGGGNGNGGNGSCEIPCNMSNTLSEILHNVELLAEQKFGGAEDFACNINGTWSSEAAGVKFEILASEGKILNISMTESDVSRQTGFMSNSTWQLSALVPIIRSGIIIINGINEKDKTVASFIGECKVCRHRDTVAGNWLYVQISRDCDNQKSCFKILSDLWTRSSVNTLRKQRIMELMMMKTTTPKTRALF